MTDRICAVEAYKHALVQGGDAVAGQLADDVVVETKIEGRSPAGRILMLRGQA